MQRKNLSTTEKKLIRRFTKYLAGINQRRSAAYIDDLSLLENYLTVKRRLGRVPSEAEVGKLGKYPRNNYRNHFGLYRNFLSIIGEPQPITARRSKFSNREANALMRGSKQETQIPQSPLYSAPEVLRKYQALKKRLHREPTALEVFGVADESTRGILRAVVQLERHLQSHRRK